MRKTNKSKEKSHQAQSLKQSGRRTSKFESFFQFPLIWMLVGTLGIVLANSLFSLLSEGSGALGTIVLTLVGGVAAIALLPARDEILSTASGSRNLGTTCGI